MPAKNKVPKERGIIEVIQQMVRAGESEEKIVSTLKTLGVTAEQAKRLLLVGQADVFSLISGEISKIVKSDVESEKPALKKFIQGETEKAVTAAGQRAEEKILGRVKNFEKKMNEAFGKVAELNDRVRSALNELGRQVKQVQVDMDEAKIKGAGGRNRLISLLLILAGIGFCSIALYYFFVRFETIVTVDSIIITVIMALIGITMLFVATVV